MLTLCAFRYCLGRATYVVSEMCNHLRNNWNKISEASQKLIKAEIKDAIKRGCAGMSFDEECWNRLLEDVDEAEKHLSGDRRDG